MCFAYVYMQLGIHSAETGDTKDPNTCLYFSAVTFTTLAYGDFTPTPDTRLIAAFEAFFGYLFLGTFAAAIVALL
jgi:predicted benzoate:H+ symporter BenE